MRVPLKLSSSHAPDCKSGWNYWNITETADGYHQQLTLC